MDANLPLLKLLDPISIFRVSCVKATDRMLEDFLVMIKHLYQYRVFKNLLDLTATKAFEKNLLFKIQNQKFFDLDEGNCKTIYSSKVSEIFNKFSTINKYQITIKKLSYEVIIHELAHMLETEAKIDLKEFESIITDELLNKDDNIGFRSTINRIFNLELVSYPKEKRASELFARYFQVIALSKEVSGLAKNNSYDIERANTYFKNTALWLESNYGDSLSKLVLPTISESSEKLITMIDQVKSSWSEQKIRPIHNQKQRKWSKAIPSIKQDPFQQ
jgi:hypothetical protein